MDSSEADHAPAAPSPKPTVLFVHGAWHSPLHFERVISVFNAAGYPTSCPRQPTFDGPGDLEMYADAACIRGEIDRLVVGQGKDVVVVAHSYGGVVASEAVKEELGKKARESKGERGGVVRLVYISGFVLDQGASLAGLFGGNFPPHFQMNENGTCEMKDPAAQFYHDLPAAEQDHYAAATRPHPATAQLTPLTYTAHKYHPVSYLYCTNDRALTIEVQRKLVKGSGVAWDEFECEASHSPYLSTPEKVLKVVERSLQK